MGKTETIKDRRVDVYLDTLTRKDRWTQIANEEGESLSKFVQKCVEYTIEQGGLDYAALGERSKKLQFLEHEVKELRKEVKQKDLVIEKLEDDLQRHQLEPFTEEDFEGTRQYDRKLVKILQEGGPISSAGLLRRLGIHPSETELMQAIDRQLEQLEAYGLITSNSQGWWWRE